MLASATCEDRRLASRTSNAQIDRLGDRLRTGELTQADLELLDQYRRTFGHAYDDVVRAIRRELGVEPSGRPAKSTGSVIDKLRRESIRLTQMQDIAGCRIVVETNERAGNSRSKALRAFRRIVRH